jgi:hypothetical protein
VYTKVIILMIRYRRGCILHKFLHHKWTSILVSDGLGIYGSGECAWGNNVHNVTY